MFFQSLPKLFWANSFCHIIYQKKAHSLEINISEEISQIVISTCILTQNENTLLVKKYDSHSIHSHVKISFLFKFQQQKVSFHFELKSIYNHYLRYSFAYISLQEAGFRLIHDMT